MPNTGGAGAATSVGDMAAIEVQGLAKHYGNLRAVDGVDLSVGVGEVYALLGPNGAGKTTTVEILAGHLRPTAGEVRVLGFEPQQRTREFRDRIGIVWQSADVEPVLRVEEAIEYYRSLYRRPLPTSLALEVAGLTDSAHVRVGRLSGGQQRRLDLALGVIGRPDVLFLDEPTTGFDPSARLRAWDVLDNLRSLGTTILLTTHYLDEAAKLADRVGLLMNGALVAEGPPDEIGGSHRLPARVSFDLDETVQLHGMNLRTGAPTRQGRRVSIDTTNPVETTYQVTRWALKEKYVLEHLAVHPPSLEDLYLSLVEHHDDLAPGDGS